MAELDGESLRDCVSGMTAKEIGFTKQCEFLRKHKTIQICRSTGLVARLNSASVATWESSGGQSGSKQRGGGGERLVRRAGKWPLFLSTVNTVSVQKLKLSAARGDFR